jgi:aspartyl/asparaginyl beta-hydroxylase (cupin superfamily)
MTEIASPAALAPRRPITKRIRKRLARIGRLPVEALERWFGRASLIGDREVFDSAVFPWVARLEAEWRTIRRELDAVLAERQRLPNLQDISPTQMSLTRDDGWKTFFFQAYGYVVDENCRRCPETARLLSAIPDLEVAFFSILSPGKHIPAHKGVYKGLIRAHLGLIVPEPKERVRMQVGESLIHWQEGKCVVFDDTYRHEVWNETDGWRVVLLIDVHRPLPPAMAAFNRAILRLLRLTPFLSESKRKHQRWEKGFYGQKPAQAPTR